MEKAFEHPLQSAVGSLVGILLATAPVSSALAQDTGWPKSYVRMVVPGGSGTAADVAARLIGQHLSELWGQQTIVENRPGAGGMTGTTYIAQSPPDGHSLLFAQGAPLSLTPHAFTSIPYNVERDFEPVIFVGVVPLVLASNVKLPVETIPELIAMASKQPGKLTFATASSRSIPHLAGEYFKQAAKIDLLHVPYVGYPQALGDTMSGTVDLILAVRRLYISARPANCTCSE